MPYTIVVTPRDKFSTTEHCVKNILRLTPGPFDLLVVMGGAPDRVRGRLESEFGGRAQFLWEPGFLNTAQMRNLALERIRTPLTVFLDSDVYVRPAWLEPLLACQAETQACLVTPLILDRQNQIHTAGNYLFITYENGQAFGTMENRFANQIVAQETNLQRCDVDFGEIHCQLVVTETARKLKIYDENLRECHEMDSGLTLSRAGCRMVFEPKSHVYLYYSDRVNRIEDVALYKWKWDMKAMTDGFDYFHRKWNIHINRRDRYKRFMEHLNRRLGFFTRRWPSSVSIGMDLALHRAWRLVVPRRS